VDFGFRIFFSVANVLIINCLKNPKSEIHIPKSNGLFNLGANVGIIGTMQNFFRYKSDKSDKEFDRAALSLSAIRIGYDFLEPFWLQAHDTAWTFGSNFSFGKKGYNGRTDWAD
jgi:hypothetical protein